MSKTTRLRWALPTTRILAAITAALVLLQGGLAGGFLSGDAALLDYHERIGTEVLTVVGLLTAVAALLAVRHLWWPLLATIIGWVGMGFQIAMGFAGQLQVHLPLGIALFGLYLTIALVARERKETS